MDAIKASLQLLVEPPPQPVRVATEASRTGSIGALVHFESAICCWRTYRLPAWCDHGLHQTLRENSFNRCSLTAVSKSRIAEKVTALIAEAGKRSFFFRKLAAHQQP